MDALRQEILESQKARSDLLKWKLVLVAGLSAVGLGFNTGGRSHPVVLVAIPLVCLYVDLLCRHQNLRIQLIAEFTRECCGEGGIGARDDTSLFFHRYECYVPARAAAFVLEDAALEFSTMAISAAVTLYGLGGHVARMASDADPVVGVVLAVSGALGLVGSVVINKVYTRKQSFLAGHVAPEVPAPA